MKARKPSSRLVPNVLNILGWSCALGALLFIDQARPRIFKTDIFFGVHRSTRWNEESVEIAFWLIVISLIVSVSVLLLEQKHATVKDETSKVSVALAILSMGAFIAHLIKFG